MIGFNFSWIEGCCVHFIERWTGQICYEFKKYLFRLLVVLEDLQGASGLKICQVAKLLNLFREQPPSENEGNVNIFQEEETISSQTERKRPLVLNVDLAADLVLDLAAGLKEAQPCPTAHILKHPLLYFSHKYVWNIFETDRYYIYDHILAQQLLYYMEARGFLGARFL